MTARPAISNVNANGASVKVTIPPEWFMSASAISRKTYWQIITLQTDIKTKYPPSCTFKQAEDRNGVRIVGPMIDSISGENSWPIAGRSDEYSITVSANYSESSAQLSVKELKKTQYASNSLDISTSVKPVNTAPEVPDYVTYVIFIEDTLEQVAGSGKFDDQALTINIVKMNPNPIPPPPPKNVIPGYNPVLDRPRPSTLIDYLKKYDVVFLLDDSGSMKGERWTEAKNALGGISNYVIDNGWDDDGLDLEFLNITSKYNFQTESAGSKDKISEIINKITPDGGTPTGYRCSQILGAHIDKLNAAKGTPAYGKIKPLDLICITDGEANDSDPANELGKRLVEAGQKIKASPQPHHPNSMGIQFVQIGNDANAKAALDKLVQLDTGHMVDTVPYAGPGSVSPDKLVRILLGGLHPNVRALSPP